MSRSFLMKKPRDDDDNDYYLDNPQIVCSKPIDERLLRKLGKESGVGVSKEFVRSRSSIQSQPSHGHDEPDESSNANACVRALSHDERNKLNAKIIKAEMKGDMNLVRELKKKLEVGFTSVDADETSSSSKKSTAVLLTKYEGRSGQVVPVLSSAASKNGASQIGAKGVRGTVDLAYGKEQSFQEVLAEEKVTSAHDQLMMFNRAAKACSSNKTDDDWVVDDNIMSHAKKRRHAGKDAGREHQKRVKEHKEISRTLDSCTLCIDSGRVERHSIVSVGFKTYLAVVNWEGISEEHCYIAPMQHYASSIQLDEDVWAEVKLWQKGLVAMWRNKKGGGVTTPDEDDDEQDCVFFETASQLLYGRHMRIECVPLPKALGDVAPIYFKKAIQECEKEWSDNPKVIDLSLHRDGIRSALPRGFPYFSINFGLQPGYAHIIEHTDTFPENFAQEIIAGMLDLEHKRWRNVRQQSFEEVRNKRDQFKERWSHYDWTRMVKERMLVETGKDEEKGSGDDKVTLQTDSSLSSISDDKVQEFVEMPKPEKRWKKK